MDYIAHHGILGMKWGIRRYQNKDGTLTEEGKRRYGVGEEYDPRRPTPEQDLAKSKQTRKAIKKGIKITGAIAIGTLLISRKARDAVGGALDHLKGESVGTLQQAGEGALKGIREGAVEGAKTSTKLATTGLVMLGMKETLDIVMGRNNADRIYRANEKKKQANPSYWQDLKGNPDDGNKKKKDDDDD